MLLPFTFNWIYEYMVSRTLGSFGEEAPGDWNNAGAAGQEAAGLLRRGNKVGNLLG